MKKVKKILCLVLALAMVFSLAIPAFAAEEEAEEEEMEAYSNLCPQCHYALKNGNFLVRTTTRVATGSCSFFAKQHNHTIPVYQNRDYCSKCGYINVLSEYSGNAQCPYAETNIRYSELDWDALHFIKKSDNF